MRREAVNYIIRSFLQLKMGGLQAWKLGKELKTHHKTSA
jgi:hypothetical protein